MCTTANDWDYSALAGSSIAASVIIGFLSAAAAAMLLFICIH